MTEPTLDRLDRDPGGARQYIATLIVVGGATNAQIAKALAAKFNVSEPTTRSVSSWRNNDVKLIALVEELAAVKRDLAPDDDLDDVLAKIPAPVDPAEASSRLLALCIESPAFAELVKSDVGNEALAPLLAAKHDSSDAEFEAACRALIADHVPDDSDAPATGGGFYGDG